MPRIVSYDQRYEMLVKYLQRKKIMLTPEQERVAKEICRSLEKLPPGGGKTTLLEALHRSDL